MNTKGMKFLAVLAVLAMAFATFAVVAPANEGDAYDNTLTAISVSGEFNTGLTSSGTIYADNGVASTSGDKDVCLGNYGLTIVNTGDDEYLLTGTAAYFDKINTTTTSYDDASDKAVWVKSAWGWNDDVHYAIHFKYTVPDKTVVYRYTAEATYVKYVASAGAVDLTVGLKALKGTYTLKLVTNASDELVAAITGSDNAQRISNEVAAGLTWTEVTINYDLSATGAVSSTATDIVKTTVDTVVLASDYTAGSLSIPAGKSLVINAAVTDDSNITYTLAKGSDVYFSSFNTATKSFISGSNLVKLKDFASTGAVKISQGSIAINGIGMSGAIADVQGDVVLSGTLGDALTITVPAGKEATIDTTNLNLNGKTLTIKVSDNGSQKVVVKNKSGVEQTIASGNVTAVAGQKYTVSYTYNAWADMSAGRADVAEITSAATSYYFYESGTVKITSLDTSTTAYVYAGSEIEFKFGTADSVHNKTFNIVTVAGDRLSETVFESTYVSFTTAKNTIFEYSAAKMKNATSGTLATGSNACIYYNSNLSLLSAGDRTQVAQGEELTLAVAYNPSVMLFKYGIQYGTNSRSFTAPGDTLSKQTITGTTPVKVVNGTVTIAYGTSYVAINGIKSAELTVSVQSVTIFGGSAADMLVIEGTTGTAGTISVYGAAYLKNMGSIDNAFTVLKGASVYSTNEFTNNGTINLKNATSIRVNVSLFPAAIKNAGTVVADNDDLWNGTAIKGIVSSTGLIDTSSISKDVGISYGDIQNLTIQANQTITLTGATNVSGTLMIYGILNVREGVTLTVSEGASIVISGCYAIVNNDGTISIKVTPTTSGGASAAVHGMSVSSNASFNNNGTITTASRASESSTVLNAAALTITSPLFSNTGSINVSKSDVISMAALNNNGAITIYGTATGSLNNYGEVSLNGASLSADLTISLAKAGAVAKVTSVSFKSGTTLTINNTGYYVSGVTDVASSVSFAKTAAYADSGYTYTVKGIEVEAGQFTSGTTKYETLFMNGTLSVNTSHADNLTTSVVTGSIAGNVKIDDNFSVPARATIANSGKLMVDGNMTMAANSALNKVSSGKLEVTGKIVNNSTSITTIVNSGVIYSTTTNEVITNLATAVTEASEASLTFVTVYGEVKQSGDLTIPAGLNIVPGTGANVVIKSGIVTLEPTAVMACNFEVSSGTFYALDATNVQGTPATDVAAEIGDGIKYMDLATAVKTVHYVVLERAVTIDEDLTIPAGVTVDSIEKGVAVTVKGATLTIDGIFFASTGFNVKDSFTTLGAVIVNGYFLSTSDVGSGLWWYPDGVHYMTTIDDVDYYVITNVSNLSTAVSQANDGILAITGSSKLGDLEIIGSSAVPVTVTFSGDVKAGTITMKDATVVINNSAKINAAFASANGYIVITDAKADSTLTITEDGKLTISGKINDYRPTDNDIAYTITFFGETYMTSFTADKGTYTAAVEATGITKPAFTVVGDLTAIGKSNNVTYGLLISETGSLIAGNSAKITVGGNVEVVGDLIASPKTESSAAGTVQITGNVYVGATYADLVNVKAKAAAAVAIVSGNITFTGTAYVLSGSYIDDSIVEDLYLLVIDVDKVLYMTLYSAAGSSDLNGFKLPISEATVSGVKNINGDDVALGYSTTYNAISQTAAFSYTTVPYINFTVNYKVYTLKIVADEGVGTVSVDGIVMEKSSNTNGSNTFTSLSSLKAGKHSISYTLASGYEGIATLSDSDGKAILGYDVTLGGSTGTKTFTLNGTTPIDITPVVPTPEEKSEWTITTILLVILVILIAVMAVIVALRLNRS